MYSNAQPVWVLDRFFATLDFMAFRQKEWGVVKQHQVSGTLGQLQLSDPRMIDNVPQDTPPLNYSDDSWISCG